MKQRFLNSSLILVFLGVGLGLLAQAVLGVPKPDNQEPSLTIERPLSETGVREEVIDLPLVGKTNLDSGSKKLDQGEPEDRDDQNNLENESNSPDSDSDGETSGLVPPLSIPGVFVSHPMKSHSVEEDFSHDPSAIHEAHGEQICASGCAASRHPTKELTQRHYQQLLSEVKIEPMDRTNNALESLLFFGSQTRKMIENNGVGDLDSKRAEFIWNELKVTHARLAIRVTDENGMVRTWLDPAEVPFDRRHVFEMKTNGVQSLVTSGTVKRVGLDHVWVRL